MSYIVLQLITDELTEMIEEYCNLGFSFHFWGNEGTLPLNMLWTMILKVFSEDLCTAGPHWFSVFLGQAQIIVHQTCNKPVNI